MLNIQTSLLDIMNYIIKELKRLNKYVGMNLNNLLDYIKAKIRLSLFSFYFFTVGFR